MNNILAFLMLTLLQLTAGFGVLTLFKIKLKPSMLLSLALLTGVGVFSVLPFLLQLFFIPLTSTSVFLSLVFACITLNVQSIAGARELLRNFRKPRFRMCLYDLPILAVIIFIIFVSAWRCFYLPPFPRDLTSGAEVIATYAVKEKTMINSVFTVNLESTNNQFKPPFITSLQIIYKYAGFPFGQVWLSTVFIGFIVFCYQALALKVHRLIAGLLIVFFLAIPEMYAYTFMVLFDYSNAVFFCLSAYFLFSYFETGHKSELSFAGLMMGIAVYVRSETLILACMLLLALLWHHFLKWDNLTKTARRIIQFIFPSLLFYFLSVTVYINLYLPVQYNVEGLINKNLLNPMPFFRRFADMNTELIFSRTGINYYGYFVCIFCVVLLLDLILTSRGNRQAHYWLYAVAVVYLGLPLIGHLLPLMDLANSTKRGLFKIFPLMLLYMGNSRLLVDLSGKIRIWEKA